MSLGGADNEDKTKQAWARLVGEVNDPAARRFNVGDQVGGSKLAPKKVDRRTLRKTGRTEQFNVRLKASTKLEIQRLAEARDWLIGEVIEHAVLALNEKLNRTGSTRR